METETKRSTKQNASLHKMFDEVARAMLEQGIERKTVVQDLDSYSCPIDATFIKEVWRAIMYTQTGLKSTTELSKGQVDKVYDTFNRFLGENYGIHIPFPSYDAMMMVEFYSNN